MKIVQINSVCGSGSTGKICVAVSKLLTAHHIENYILYAVGASDNPLAQKYMTPTEVKIGALKSRMTGRFGFQSAAATRRLIRELDAIAPDVVHLHNIHSHNVHLQLLFSYFKRKKIKIFWTFHDCFAFTAYCMYFDMVQCDRWQHKCERCPQYRKYSWFFDRSRALYQQKKALFSGLDLTIITPSQWLADLTKKSFLKDYPVKVIHNGIDLRVFTPRKSGFRTAHGILEEQTVLLGVANKWEPRKGLDVFIRLANELDREKFRIVLVGTNDDVDRQLPAGVISIHRTSNQQELADIYSAADYFVNPTREDNFPTVNIEALACGTPVVTFDTGGSPESLTADCGFVIGEGNYEQLYRVLNDLAERRIPEDVCTRQAAQFDQDTKFKEYLALYLDAEAR